MRKALTSFKDVKDNSLTELAKEIILAMSNNDDFKNPTPSLKDVEKSEKEYENALIKAQSDGTSKEVEHKNVKKAELQKILSNLATFVNLHADGDLEKLKGSGFPLNKAPSAIGILPAPHSFELSDGDANSIKITIDTVAKANSYIVQYRKDGEQSWSSELFTKAAGAIKNLTSVTKYEFRVAATSSESSKNNEYNFTQVKTRVVQ
ncbi:MAG: hypothetical protein GQ570_10840 [Helicobacteraceae bacterium]|nr:hypothetical protein [Helicobacteraceae bacterium]